MANPTPSPREDEGNPLKDVHKGNPKSELLETPLFELEETIPEKKTEPAPETPDLTVAIYSAYPRKAAKPAALKAIKAAMKRLAPEKLLAAVQVYAKLTQAGNVETKFIPHPATWFNQDRWNDLSNPTTPTTHDRIPEKW